MTGCYRYKAEWGDVGEYYSSPLVQGGSARVHQSTSRGESEGGSFGGEEGNPEGGESRGDEREGGDRGEGGDGEREGRVFIRRRGWRKGK